MAHHPALSKPSLHLVRSVDDADLVARCKSGEPAALRKLFDSERKRVHRLLFRVVGSNVAMDDLLQDTFLEVYRSLPGFRGESSIRTWIDRCAVRVAYAYFRRKSRAPWLEPVHDVPSQAASPEERASGREAIRRLYAALEHLEATQRLAFTLTAVEGLTSREVAQLMDCSVATAKLRAWRARRALESRARKDALLSEFLADRLLPEQEENQ
jgi:RNA polymerase sigma-70 factor (ECF subfamily)